MKSSSNHKSQADQTETLTCLGCELVSCAQPPPSTFRTVASSAAAYPTAVIGWCCHVIVCEGFVINITSSSANTRAKIPEVILVKQNKHKQRTWHGPLILAILEHHNIQQRGQNSLQDFGMALCHFQEHIRIGLGDLAKLLCRECRLGCWKKFNYFPITRRMRK